MTWTRCRLRSQSLPCSRCSRCSHPCTAQPSWRHCRTAEATRMKRWMCCWIRHPAAAPLIIHDMRQQPRPRPHKAQQPRRPWAGALSQRSCTSIQQRHMRPVAAGQHQAWQTMQPSLSCPRNSLHALRLPIGGARLQAGNLHLLGRLGRCMHQKLLTAVSNTLPQCNGCHRYTPGLMTPCCRSATSDRHHGCGDPL